MILDGFHAAAACSRVQRNSVPSTQMRCMITANRRASSAATWRQVGRSRCSAGGGRMSAPTSASVLNVMTVGMTSGRGRRRDQSSRRSFGFAMRILAASSLCMEPDVGDWSAPCVMAALTGVVHDREGAADTEHNHGQDNQQGGLHGDLAKAGPRLTPSSELSRLQ